MPCLAHRSHQNSSRASVYLGIILRHDRIDWSVVSGERQVRRAESTSTGHDASVAAPKKNLISTQFELRITTRLDATARTAASLPDAGSGSTPAKLR